MSYFFRVVFGRMQKSFLIRHYIFGLALFLVLLYSKSFSVILFGAVCFALYPFSMFVYDSVVWLVMGDVVIFKGLVVAFIWGIIKVVVVFLFGVFLAPFGMLYIYSTRDKTMA